MALKITVPLHVGQDEKGGIVRQTKLALNRLGFYTPDSEDGMSEEVEDEEFEDALHAFRRVMTIPFDETDIGPGSLTDRLLREELERQNTNERYIWRTVGDEKVRGTHALRGGRVFTWNTPPEGGHPGEDHNCRCWAEAVTPRWHTWSDWLEERRTKRNTLQSLAPPLGLNDALITNPPTGAIEPAWISPLDFIGLGSIAVRKIIITALSKAQMNHIYRTALAGGKHSGALKRYRNASNQELQKGIRSFDRQINRHLYKIKNPEKEYPDFKRWDKRQQKALLEKIWPLEIKRFQEEKEILRRILNERH